MNPLKFLELVKKFIKFSIYKIKNFKMVFLYTSKVNSEIKLKPIVFIRASKE